MSIKEDLRRFIESHNFVDFAVILIATALFTTCTYSVLSYVDHSLQHNDIPSLDSKIFYTHVDYGDGYRWQGMFAKGEVRENSWYIPPEWLVCDNVSEGYVIEKSDGYYLFNMTDEEMINYLKMYSYYQKEPLQLTIEHVAGDFYINETCWRIWPWASTR